MATESAFLYNLATALSILLNIVFWALVARTGLKLAKVSVGGPVGDALTMVTRPVLAPLEKWVPRFGGYDFAPLVAAVGIQLIQRLVLV